MIAKQGINQDSRLQAPEDTKAEISPIQQRSRDIMSNEETPLHVVTGKPKQ